MDLDAAFANVKTIYSDFDANRSNVITEEDAKIQLINRMFVEVLGWKHSDIRAEQRHENGYSDYLIFDKDSPCLVVEAKRIGLLEVGTSERNKLRHLKLAGPGLKACNEGIDQVANYAQPNGLPVSILTDGLTWIVFKSFIPGENYKDKPAFVFPSLDAIISNFSVFFDLLSKAQFQRKIYNSRFDEIHQNRVSLSRTLYSPLSENEINIQTKSPLAFDLDKVFATFFSRLKGENDPDLLVECFVESRESRIADFSLEKITTAVLGNIVSDVSDVDTQLSDLIESSVDIGDGQTVFIVGPTGAGKTTFLDRFFRKTLSSAVRKRCLVVSVNFLDSSGTIDNALHWITEQIIAEIESGLFEDGVPSWEDLRGLYFDEYQRRSKGVDRKLYERDPDAFREKFGNRLDELVENDREGYLKRLLANCVNSRNFLPILIIDNTDEFSDEYKRAVFQYAQSLRRHAKHCILVFPATDKSAWGFSKTDIFGIYETKSFFLPTPSPREIFRKRIEYLKRKLDSDDHESAKTEYFLEKGIKISVSDLNAFASVVDTVFVNHEYASKTIGELSNYNIRRTLSLSKRVITSAAFKIDDLIGGYLKGEIVAPNFNKFLDALLKGDYEAFRLNDRHNIFPIFQCEREVLHSPLLGLRILALLGNQLDSNRKVEDQHLSCQSIFDYFDAMGCSELAVDRLLMSLLEAKLIEPFDPSVNNLSAAQRLAITFSGKAHLRLGRTNNVFFTQMALSTAISDEDVAQQIKGVYGSNSPFAQKMSEVRRLFWDFLLKADEAELITPDLVQFNCQRELVEDLSRFGNPQLEKSIKLAEEIEAGTVHSEVLGTVDFYDAERGFGFVDVDGVDGRVFLHAEKLAALSVDALGDGDVIMCDVGRSEKGLFVELIHDIELDQTEIIDCRIVKLLEDRGYGFVSLSGSKESAFFHFSVFNQEQRTKLQIGQTFAAVVSFRDLQKGAQVKKLA